ncbi:putative transporter [Cladophialophora carrionii]|uniref:Putative transporter n=1 Tax=Cladophialophora carrionii TaxID=86049 RepID=A0A1C1CHR6_9EURO|nr:putative transporter [Cladophialophora carrionii]
MDRIERILSRPVAKPYRSGKIDPSIQPFRNQYGHLDFAPGDIENPKEWSTKRRWYCTIVAVVLVCNATFASSSPSGCLRSISEHFQVSEVAAGLVITLFLLGYVAGPLLFAPLSEFYGRRYVFYVTFTCYNAFNFLCAFAPNFGSLLVGRLLTGTFASAPLTNAPGVLADVWGPIERGNAMAIFSMMTFIGPAIGPVISGFLELKENWRWSFYVLLWLGGATQLLMFTIPETLPAVVLINKARRLRATGVPEYQDIRAPAEAEGRDLGAMFKIALLRPWQILFDPISFLVAIYLSIVYLLLYMLFTIYPIVFQEQRGWNSGVGELPLIGTVIGACIGGAVIFYKSHRERKKMEAGLPQKPEDRLPLAMLGGISFAITMFWFAWTANFNSIHWFVPTLAGTFLSASIMIIFVSYLNYLTDTYLMYTASAMAANTICRSACGAAAPLFTNQMFHALGVGGGGSLIGGVACLLAPIPFVFYKYGERIRVRSRFAPTNQTPPGDEEKQADPSDAAADKTDSPSSSSSSSTDGLDTETSSHLGPEVPEVEEKKADPDEPRHDLAEAVGGEKEFT